jgi:hypothetical protein
MSGGQLGGDDTVNVAGLFKWDGGEIEGKTSPNAVLNASGGIEFGTDAKLLDQRTLNLTSGTNRISGPDNTVRLLNDTIFNNQATLEFADDGGDDEQGFTGSGTFNNQGVLRKLVTGNAGITRFEVEVNNTGTVEVQAGTLRFTGGYVQTCWSPAARSSRAPRPGCSPSTATTPRPTTARW